MTALLVTALALLWRQWPVFGLASATPTQAASATLTLPPPFTPSFTPPEPTRTPAPASATAKATVAPTSTRPTRRPSASATPSVASNTATQPASPTTLPAQYDLVYLAGEQLLRWGPETNQLENLAEDALEFTIQPGGRQLVWLHPAGSQGYTLETIDLATNERKKLADSAFRPYQISLSPDGRFLAYYGQPDGGLVFIMPLADPEQVFSPGECTAGGASCEKLVWERDGRSLVWGDARGLWLASPNDSSARQVLDNQVQVTDPRGGSSQVRVIYQPQSWSPLGRYLLAISGPPDSQARWLVVVDTRLNRQVEVEGSFGYTLPAASGGWLRDGQLAVVHHNPSAAALPTSLDLWQITSTRDPFIDRITEIDLSTQLLPELAPSDYIFLHLAEIDDKLVSLAFSQLNVAQLFYYQLDLKTGSLSLVLSLAAGPGVVLPSPDGKALLIQPTGNPAIYLHGSGEELLQINLPNSAQAFGFTWVQSLGNALPR